MILYELSENYRQVQDLIENGADNLNDTLQSLSDAIEEKAVNYAKIIKNIESQSLILKNEETRLQEKRKKLDNNVKKLKQSLEISMIHSNIKKINSPLFVFNIQKNVPSLKISDDAEIPHFYFVEQTPKLDKRALLEDVKAKKIELEGVELRQTESLRIR